MQRERVEISVANKRSVRRDIKRLEHVRTWQLLVLLLLSLFVAATFLRLNNVGMVERRDAVYSADENGDEYVIADRLYDLQRYSAAHMNASSGDVYLDNLYKKGVESAIKKAEEANAASSKKSAEILRQAYITCKTRYPGYSLAYTLCVGEEQDKIPANTVDVVIAEFPSPSLYRHSFISPVWSPDYAGWSVLVSLLLGGAVILRVIVGLYLRWKISRHYRSV